MSNFSESRWANSDFSKNFRDEANIYLPWRSQFIETAISIFALHFGKDQSVCVLDLGCGDGLFAACIRQVYPSASITLVDGSGDMLEAARNRLGNETRFRYQQMSFQQLIHEDRLEGNFDFVFSSLAIHHLPFAEKQQLYAHIFKLLNPGGLFLHYDVVLPPSVRLEQWYLALWRQWIQKHPDKQAAGKLLDIPNQYKDNADNMPDRLDSQLNALQKIGFQDVDCICKYGIFSLFGGCK